VTRGDSTAAATLERAWRDERTKVVATLTRRLGDLQLAEDAVQEAFATAAVRWQVDGVPDRPGAWLTTTAWRKALDVIRRERFPLAGQTPEPAHGEAVMDEPEGDLAVEDDVLTLILTCCHPALAPEARVALTLRHVAGLTSREIAAGFLVQDATMDKRLVRARAKIRDARIAFTLPDRAELLGRLEAVHAVIYLIFTEGYLATGEQAPVRAELCDEAEWLARQLHHLVPHHAETTGLLALLLLQNARTAARQDAHGELIPYDEQDRGRWDTTSIDSAKQLLGDTGAEPPGPYQVQAAIALLHATAGSADTVNWPRIADLYAILARLTPSDVIELNRAVALGRADGPNAGLAVLAPVLAAGRLERYPPLHAAHADLLQRAGRSAEARTAWEHAAALAPNQAQRTQLLRRASAAAAPPTPPPGP
jgi:RNA polymerase sigma-70 factor (ECF subfamily)